MEIRGLDAFQKKLQGMGDRARELDGTHEVPLTELFNSQFMTGNTDFESFETFLEAGGFTVESKEDFEAIPEVDWISSFATTPALRGGQR